MRDARRPRVFPLASTTYQSPRTVADLANSVFIMSLQPAARAVRKKGVSKGGGVYSRTQIFAKSGPLSACGSAYGPAHCHPAAAPAGGCGRAPRGRPQPHDI